MLSFPAHTRVYLCVGAVDLRKGFDGLCGLVESVFQRDVLDGHLFLFINKRRDRIKALWWDRDGLAIYYKRLERGEFRFPKGEDRSLAIDSGQLVRLLSGLELVAQRTA